ncbi:alpha/beta hydrolase [Thiocystis violascens]|uniref:Uncharacterized protein n=1 Tax=Thiocystis violascens (strain ATCC 17096 / DSM 198 / 6111) TaxID=765911 RepID=I3Y6H9_THIV6|nr:alpha/beta hydrolase [Thiocystis violascens]AFL72597.1 hypothetical protein Thivi_0537 [Thiocystis violascens DSM 198]
MKRLFTIGGLVLAVLLGSGAYVYFLSTSSTLERAESFQFRRMQVARVGEDGVYRFFYVTNRVPNTTDAPLEERWSATRDEQLRFGRFDTAIQPTLGLGMWLDAGMWFLEEEIQIVDTTALEQADFSRQLRRMVADSPQRSLLILVHGFRTDFPHAMRGTAFLSHILDIDTPVMVFDWPADQGSSLGGYRRAQRMATDSAAELAAALKLVVNEIAPERIWLVANSMGAQVVADTFSLLYRDPAWADAAPEIAEVVLTAPDVSRARFTEQFKHELAALANHTTVYVSANDRALLVSRAINRGRRLGESTLSKGNAMSVGATAPALETAPDTLSESTLDADLADVADLLEIIEPGSERVTLVDVTPINRTRNFHNFSFEVPEYFDDIFMRLLNRETPENRLRYELRTPEGKLYSVLTRGR